MEDVLIVLITHTADLIIASMMFAYQHVQVIQVFVELNIVPLMEDASNVLVTPTVQLLILIVKIISALHVQILPAFVELNNVVLMDFVWNVLIVPIAQWQLILIA